jgi:hypothetical protein
MKKVLMFLLVFVLASSVLAMEDPISVKTDAGNTVKIYAWPSEVGPILNSDKGVADEEGVFNTTFFSLNVPTFKLQVLIVDSNDDKIRDDKFEGMSVNDPIFVDCVPSVCTVSVGEIVPEEVVEEDLLSNETSPVDNAVSVDSEVVSFGVLENWLISGKAIFVSDGGSLKIGSLIIGLTIFLLTGIIIFMIFHKGKSKEGVSLKVDDDEKELVETERKVKETEDKINIIKEKKERAEKLRNAKEKLAEEERELRELESGGDVNAIAKQKEVVDSASDEVKENQSS